MDYDLNKLLSQSDRDEIERAVANAKPGALPSGPASPLCALRLHRWSKWWVEGSGEIHRDGLKVGMWSEQRCVCFGCGKILMRLEEWQA